jgi:hypothetical protein
MHDVEGSVGSEAQSPGFGWVREWDEARAPDLECGLGIFVGYVITYPYTTGRHN